MPFIFISTHRIKDGSLDEFRALTPEYVDFCAANEPGLLALHAYVDEREHELSLVQVHEDAASFAQHMQVAGERVHEAVRLVENVAIEIYGPLTPDWREQLHAAGDPGLPVRYAPTAWAGYSRTA